MKSLYSKIAYTYSDEEFAAFCFELAAEYPSLIHLSSIGTSAEGRPIRLLTVTDFSTPTPADAKPGYFIQGTIHSKELSGTVAALQLAELLAQKNTPDDILSRAVFYIIPRCNPDGAHRSAQLDGPQGERSSWGAPVNAPNVLHMQDMDGDGIVRMMRIESPDGCLVKSPDHPYGLIGRQPDSTGPFYNHMLEGYLVNWDGTSIPNWPPFDLEYIDWNRNWPVGWSKDQVGAGSGPLSVPEVKTQADWLEAHRNIRFAVALHNGYASALFPEVQDDDADYFANLAELAERLVGVPAFGQDVHAASDTQVKQRGQFTTYCYRQLGIPAVTFELGTRENSAGADSRELYVRRDAYTNPLEVLRQQDEHPELIQCFSDWKPFYHPQFGRVEIGGMNPTLFANPLPEYLQERIAGIYQFLLRISE